MDSASTSIVKELVEKSWTHVTSDSDAITSLCVQLVENKKNVQCLIEDSLHCFRELSNGRGETASRQCCVSLHLMGLIVSHLSATPSGYEIIGQLSVSPGLIPPGAPLSSVFLKLIDKALAAVSTNSFRFSYQYDIAYYSASFLQCCLSGQLYKADSDGTPFSSIRSVNGITLQHIHVKAESELNKIRHSRPDYDILDTMAGQLLRSLLSHGTSVCAPPAGSLVAALVSKVNKKISLPTSIVRSEVSGAWSATKGLQLLPDIGNEDLRTRDNASSTAIVQEALGLTNVISKLFLKSLIALVTLSFVYIATFWRPFHPRQDALLNETGAASDSLEAGISNCSVEAERKLRSVPCHMPESPLSAKCLSLLLLLLHTDVNRSSDTGDRSAEDSADTAAKDPAVIMHGGAGLEAILDTFRLLRDESVGPSARPVQAARANCSNGSGPTPLEIGCARAVHVDSMALCTWLKKAMAETDAGGVGPVLLLYSLLQVHTSFLHSAIHTGQAAVLLSSLLHALYITVETVNTNRRKIKSLRRGGYRVHRKADTVGSEGRETSLAVPALASRHLYTVCVCLLMMVSSQAVQPLLSSTVAAPWYLERRHKQVGVEELVLLCVLKAVTQEISMARKGEEEGEGCALLSTCYAVLLTVAPLLREASMYMAERLAAVVTTMCRRIISNEQAAAADERIKEALSVVLLVVDAALQPHCRGSNASIVIAMMQEQEHLVPSLRHRAVNEAVGPLLIALTPVHADATTPMLPTELCLLVTHYLQLLEGYSENGLSTLRSTMRQESDSVQHRVRGSGSAMVQGTGTSYCYEEGPYPGAFFLPAVWGFTLRSSPDLCRLLPLHCAVLLDPYDAGLLDCDSTAGETGALDPPRLVDAAQDAV